MRFWLGSALVVGFLAGTVLACGTADEGDGGEGGSGSEEDGGDKSSGSSSKSSFTCCINDTNYTCPNKAAFDKCAGFDIDGCMQACDPGDFACQDDCFAQWGMSDNDPSDCNEDPDASCGGPTTSSGPTTTSGPGGNCSDNGAGCDLDDDCCSGNCANNTCESNDVGSPCDLDDDCDSGNCYSNVCNGNSAGDGCDLDDDCNSGNCFNNECQ